MRAISPNQNSGPANLSERAEYFQLLVENINAVFWIATIEPNQVVYVSPSYEKIFGLPCDQLYKNSMDWTSVVISEDKENAQKLKGFDGPHLNQILYIQHPTKGKRCLNIKGSRVRELSDRGGLMLGITEDITDFMRLQEQHLQSQKIETIGQMASGVAHDFNNYLNVILGNCSLLSKNGNFAKKERGQLKDLTEAGQRAHVLTQKLLAFARSRKHETEKIELNDIVRKLRPILARLAGRTIKIKLALDPRVKTIRSDSSQVEQVLLNLIMNSKEAMPKGGLIRIGTENCSILKAPLINEVEVPEGKYILLTVTDNGTGMDSLTQKNIFDPFYTTKSEGVGLGLATVVGIVKRAQGYISVKSKLTKGARFAIYFPQEL